LCRKVVNHIFYETTADAGGLLIQKRLTYIYSSYIENFILTLKCRNVSQSPPGFPKLSFLCLPCSGAIPKNSSGAVPKNSSGAAPKNSSGITVILLY
jgi:hypothetical protein